jgi:hypothetical protein
MNGNQERIAEACERAGAVLAAARAERDQTAAAEGAEGLAEFIAPGCTPAQRAEAVAYWEQLQQQAAATSAA